MASRTSDSTAVSPGRSLGTFIAAVRSASASADRIDAVRRLVDEARRQCAGAVKVNELVQAADALLDTLESKSVDTEADAEPDTGAREAFERVVHDFIDLARLKTIRRAAYPADRDTAGGQWIDRICRLIEESHFTTGRMFRQRAASHGDKILFRVPQGEQVIDFTWTQVLQESQAIARGIIALIGDDPRVAIFSPNRVEGALVDLACLTNGIFNTMVPANVVESQLVHILFESRARILVVAGTAQFGHAKAAMAKLDSLEWIITLDSHHDTAEDDVMTLADLKKRGEDVPAEELDRRLAKVRSRDTATTMYTSGTTGMPKGIKFSHLNIVSKRYARAAALPEIDEDEVFLCYLPLYHTFGRYLEMLAAVHLAATYIFAENASTETLLRHMHRFRPTALISVPKKWSDLYRHIVGADDSVERHEDVRRELSRLTGGRLAWGLSAAGRLDPSIFKFFQSHGIDLLSGYGMTEATGGITMSIPKKYAEDSIGKALPGIECKLDEDGELLLRGPYVSEGYANPEDDAVAFRDGWFCTGDILSLDATGCFRHVDRKKDIYKSSGGRTIAPQRVESLFADFPEVSRVFAVGDGRDYVTLLIRPNVEYKEIAFDQMPEADKREYFRGLVASCNRFLAPFERVVRFTLIDREFSAALGELTSKESFCRAVVERHFADVIEPMYKSSSIERMADGLRVKIPISFLQHLGVTASGTQSDDKGIVFRSIGKKLRIARDPTVADRVWIGNCCYDAVEESIDLDNWLRMPHLWVGNAELTYLTGESILLWSLSGKDRAIPSQMVLAGRPDVPVDKWKARLAAPRRTAPNLLSIHAAAVILSSAAKKEANRAVDSLSNALTTGRIHYQELAESHLQHAANHADAVVRSRAFVALYDHQSASSFGRTASVYCGSRLAFLSEEACRRIASTGVKARHWYQLTRSFASLRRSVAQGGSAQAIRSVETLLTALVAIAEQNEDFHLPVRRELAAWRLAPVTNTIHALADRLTNRLASSLRDRLGSKQAEAIDPNTRRRYTWGETLRFEDGIDAAELGRLGEAIQHTELVREAVYLLHRKRRIDLSDLASDSIWITLVSTRFGNSVYHVGIRLRNGERCDFNIHVRGTATVDEFLTDLRLSCVAAGGPGETPLTPQVGGYWPGQGLATVEHIPGESVEALLKHMHEHTDRDVGQRLKNAWRHLAWSTLAAAFEFCRRSEGRWVLTGAVAQDIAVPLDDFQARTRIITTSGWRRFEGTLDLILRLKGAFLDRVRFHFPTVGGTSDEEWLFAAVVEANGLRDGSAFLENALREIEGVSSPAEEVSQLGQRMKSYLGRLKRDGYMPRTLHFAIRRYKTWAREVPGADVQARAAQLRELQKNYKIDAAARRFPGSRLRLYAETVLADSPAEGRATIDQAIRRLREGAGIREVLGRLYVDLQERLPSSDHQYFLARAAYPHLDVEEKAELVPTSEVGIANAELVTTHTDRKRREFRIRPVANSREVDTLHRVFYVGGIGGGVVAHETFLVAVDENKFVLGGVASTRQSPDHVLLDKIAVLPRCRGRGIGRILLCEFLRRQAADGVQIVSAEFIRASWLAQFGFVSHPRYAGLVREFESEDVS